MVIQILNSGDNVYKMASAHRLEPYKIYYNPPNIEYRAQYPSTAVVPVGARIDVPTNYSPMFTGAMPIQAECMCSKVLTLEAATEIPACCPYTVFVGSYLLDGLTHKSYSSRYSQIRFTVTDANDVILNAFARLDAIATDASPMAITLFPQSIHIGMTIKVYADITSPKEEAVLELTVVEDDSHKHDVISCIHTKANVTSRASWGATGPWVNDLEEHWGYDTITIHHSGNTERETPQDIEHEHRGNYSDIGYHFLIAKDGTIYEGRELRYKGSHVSRSNSSKIGICLLGDFSERGEQSGLCGGWEPRDSTDFSYNGTVLATQEAALTELCSVLIECLKIDHLGGHREHSPGAYCRSCPGNVLMAVVRSLRTQFGLPV